MVVTTGTPQFTISDVLEGLDYAIQAHGEHRTIEECVYVNDDDTPHCIVGVVLDYLGLLNPSWFQARVSPNGLSLFNNERNLSQIAKGEEGEIPDFIYHLTDDAIAVLRAAQASQDLHWKWGSARTDAYEEAQRLRNQAYQDFLHQ